MERGTRKQMRLKHGDQAVSRKRLPRRGQRCRDFCRVMRIIVHHRYSTCFPQPFEEPSHPAKLRQCRCARLHVGAQCVQHGQRRGCVAHVMQSGHRKRELHRVSARHRQRRARPTRF